MLKDSSSKREYPLSFRRNINLRLLSRKIPLYMTCDNKVWDVAGDGFECLDDMGLLEIANLSLDEPELEEMIFIYDDIDL
ncbi:hypothetical protein KFK09_015124 [Dendrobium nobile]|uniref:Uncharacterized protein n=1 Tax=Dendrobium nobile TaxID=94219 RepID=A0A8T3B5A4_DENNO|nr:hypothetical protein KFK09_015124 [Dendrobium nobile]